MIIFFNFICYNQVVADFLKKKFTFENLYNMPETKADNNMNVN